MYVRSMAFAGTDSCRLLCGLYVMSKCLSWLGPLGEAGEVIEDGARTSGVLRRRWVLGAVGWGGGDWREGGR